MLPSLFLTLLLFILLLTYFTIINFFFTCSCSFCHCRFSPISCTVTDETAGTLSGSSSAVTLSLHLSSPLLPCKRQIVRETRVADIVPTSSGHKLSTELKPGIYILTLSSYDINLISSLYPSLRRLSYLCFTAHYLHNAFLSVYLSFSLSACVCLSLCLSLCLSI